MSVTAVPLRPLAKGSLTRLWIGVAAALLVAGGLAVAGTAKMVGNVSESGLGFKVVKDGEGASPTDEDVVLVSYVGKLPDGKVFDQNQQAVLEVAGVVPGFSEGLKKMKRGGSYTLTIPPQLGYGDTATGPIPANSTLTFDVTLLDFKSRAEIMQMQQQMQMQGMPGAPGGAPHPLPGQ